MTLHPIQAPPRRTLAKNFPRSCPFCGLEYLTYAPDPPPKSWLPGVPEGLDTLTLGGGHRSTCGHPLCHEEAIREFGAWEEAEWARRNAARRERESLDRAQQEQASRDRDY